MSNSLKNSIGYSGIVKIAIKKGKNTIKSIIHHNAGTAWLFKLLSSVLCGNDESRNMPKYLDIGNINNEGNFDSYLIHRCPIIGRNVENQDFKQGSTLYTSSYAAIFTSTISSLWVKEENSQVSILRLYSNMQGGDENLLAQVKLNDNDVFEVSYQDNYNYLIEWIMVFENAIKEQES